MGTGVCAIHDSGEPGTTVLIRAELDALPIQESNDFAHRSTVPGVAHKCGHDGHMATLVAVADDLHRRPPARGRVYLLFQPAEETGTGAAAVIDDPRFAALPAPDRVFAFHNIPRYPLGTVLLRRGVFAQGSVGFIARFHGRTSHSSYPEHSLNPAAAVAQLITTVNGFHCDEAERFAAPVLGTISYAQLGNADNGPNFGTTPGEALVMGVLRAHRSEDLTLLRALLVERVELLAADDGLATELSWHEAFEATVSNERDVELVAAAAAACGLEVHELDAPFRWSEDFGHFTQCFGGAFFGLGSGIEQPQLHDNRYDYPDSLIVTGARLYREIIDRSLQA
jgi:amidohydrolase